MLQDETGFIQLLYRQPLGFLEFLFGFLKAKDLVGRKLQVTGWYRRAPMPYLEIKSIKFEDGEQVNCHMYIFQLIVGIVGIIVGLGICALGLSLLNFGL